MRSLVVVLLFVISSFPVFGQQIVLNFGSLGNYFVDPTGKTAPNVTTGPIDIGTVQTTVKGANVTLTSGSTFLKFTTSNGGTCTANLPSSQTISTVLNTATHVFVCIVNAPAWNTYYGLITASAFGFRTVSVALELIIFPSDNVNANPTTVDLSTASTAHVVMTNNLPTPAFSPLAENFLPNVPGWLNVTESGSCTTVKNGGSCTLTLSPNPTASGLQPGTYVAQLAYDANGNRAAVAVTYTYNPAPLKFVPALPCRVADTRNTAPPIVAGGSTRSFQISGVCGVPTTAKAYSLNVTVVPTVPLGFLAAWPGDQAQPVVSTLNSDGRVKAAAAIVPAGADGTIKIFASNETHVILDVDGYFVPASTPSALSFYPVTPCRLADTRNANGTLGGPILSAAATRTFPIAGTCGVPASAQAYSLNFTAVPPDAIGFLTAWQAGVAQPTSSTLNAPARAVTANAAIIPAGTAGSVSVFSSHDTHLIIDVNGYFAPSGSAGALSFYTVNPCRVIDSRNPQGSAPFMGAVDVNFATSPCAVPTIAQAYVSNATVVPSGVLGFLSLWPQGQSQPLVSTLNADRAVVASNMAIVPTTNGSITAFASDPTFLILDVSGYFSP